MSDREQQVSVNGKHSEWTTVTSGIPPSSFIEPILFALYINDLPKCIVSDVYMFADDTKFLKTINNPTDQHALQDDLDYLTSWSSKLLLRFQSAKCKLVHLGTK